VPDETVEQCNRSHPKQSLRIGTACTLCIAASRSPCRRYQGRAICPFGGAGDTLQPHRHLSMTPPRLHQLARRPPPAARVHLLDDNALHCSLARRMHQVSGQRTAPGQCRRQIARCHFTLCTCTATRTPTPHSTYCTNPHQTTPDQTKPTQTRPNYAKPQDQRRVPFSISRLNRVEMWRCIHFSNSQKPPRPPARVRSNQTVYQATHLAAHSGF
jgi:hypothetical protein